MPNIHLCPAARLSAVEKVEAGASADDGANADISEGSAALTGKAAMLSIADACSKLKEVRKRRDPYWKVRFCELCIKRVRSARRTLMLELAQRDMEE
jgi:hypothetical protein